MSTFKTKYLLFEVKNKDIQYVLVSDERIYLLNEKEYALLRNADHLEILTELRYIAREEISAFTTSKGSKELVIFDVQKQERLSLNFLSISARIKFVKAFPNFKRQMDKSKTRIQPIVALILMLFTYSFIWAGTRPDAADINPEGIRWRLAYINVQFLEWLNSLIGQQLILIIGILLLLTLLFFIFKPELRKLFSQKLIYSNSSQIAQ